METLGIGPSGQLGPVKHTRVVRSQFRANRKEVLFLTGMTDEALTHFQRATVVQWLLFQGNMQEETFALMRTRSEVWDWWMYYWNLRDEGLLPSLYRQFITEARRFDYIVHHNRVFVPTSSFGQDLITSFKHLKL